MRVHVVDHPLVAHKLTALRDERTDSPTFRRLADELVTLLAYEATRDVRVEPVEVATPGRAGHGRAAVRARSRWSCRSCGPASACSTAWSGCCPPPRSASSAWSATSRRCRRTTYATRLPDDLSGRQCYLLDPMLATGGTLAAAIHFLIERGADDVTAICLLAAPEGIALLERGRSAAPTPPSPSSPPALDERLNELGYIVPGLGDAGDRLYGVV